MSIFNYYSNIDYYLVIMKVFIPNIFIKLKQNMSFYQQYNIFNILDFKLQNKIIYYYESDNKLNTHFNFVRLCNTINDMLSINKMLKFIVENVFYP